jgi:RNA polymerase sigma-70 factor (ECF subfamily)
LCAYAYRVGRNIALKKLRSNTATIRRADYDLSLEELADCIPAGDLWEQMEAKELGQLIARFLDGQAKENRVVFLRRYWFGDSAKAIAASLGLKERTVSARLSRTRAALKDYLNKEGYSL